MYFVYVLQSVRTKEFYKGLSEDFEKRLRQHFAGECQTTSKMLPLRIVHVEICDNRIAARKLEKFLKSGYGREIVKELAAESVVSV